MSVQTADLNETPRVTGTFHNAAAALADPTAVTATVTTPAGVATVYVYGTDAQLVKASTGVYYIDPTLNAAGRWTVTIAGTGTVASTETTDFIVGISDLYAGGGLYILNQAEARAALNLPADPPSSDDPRIDQQVAVLNGAVSARLDESCGAVVRRTITAELHDGGWDTVRLKHPAAALTTVVEYQATTPVTLTRETVGTAPSDGYYADPHQPNPSLFSGTLRRRSGGSDTCFYRGRGNIAVTYSAGRFTSTATVTERFKQAAAFTLLHLWKPSSAQWSQAAPAFPGGSDVGGALSPVPGWAVPRAVKEMLRDEWRELPGIA